MKTLLGYIGKERHADSLVEKLMLRFEAATSPAQWKNLAFCLTQVPCYALLLSVNACSSRQRLSLTFEPSIQRTGL